MNTRTAESLPLATIKFSLFTMTDKDKQLLSEFDYGIITVDVFLKNFSVDIKSDTIFVRTEIKNAI